MTQPPHSTMKPSSAPASRPTSSPSPTPSALSPSSSSTPRASVPSLCHRDPEDRLILQPEDLQQEWIVNARALHLDGHDTAAATLAARWARAAGVPVIADLDEPYPDIDPLLENIDYLIVSRDFPSRLMQEPSLERALQQMQRRYNSCLTAATLGSEGVLAWTAATSTMPPPTVSP